MRPSVVVTRCGICTWADGRWFRVSRDGCAVMPWPSSRDYAALANAEFTLSAVTGAAPTAGWIWWRS